MGGRGSGSRVVDKGRGMENWGVEGRKKAELSPCQMVNSDL